VLGFREHLTSCAEHVINDGAVHVGTIDVKLGELEALVPNSETLRSWQDVGRV